MKEQRQSDTMMNRDGDQQQRGVQGLVNDFTGCLVFFRRLIVDVQSCTFAVMQYRSFDARFAVMSGYARRDAVYSLCSSEVLAVCSSCQQTMLAVCSSRQQTHSLEDSIVLQTRNGETNHSAIERSTKIVSTTATITTTQSLPAPLSVKI